jgi:hypothetical protein
LTVLAQIVARLVSGGLDQVNLAAAMRETPPRRSGAWT